MALTGKETLEVLGQYNGSPAASTFTTTTQAIANLAAAGGSNIVATALNTVGAGTITAAGIVGKVTTRGGTQVAVFTDTTATAAAIITALGASAAVGESFKYVYVNNTVFPATIAAGSGVTLTGAAVVPANGYAEFLVTYSATGAVTFLTLGVGFFPSTGTFTANGATAVTVANTKVTANSQVSFTLGTVGGTVGAVPAIKTITPGTGFTVAATASDTSVYNYLIEG